MGWEGNTRKNNIVVHTMIQRLLLLIKEGQVNFDGGRSALLLLLLLLLRLLHLPCVHRRHDGGMVRQRPDDGRHVVVLRRGHVLAASVGHLGKHTYKI